MNKRLKIIAILLISALMLCLAGCRSFFVPRNAPITVTNATDGAILSEKKLTSLGRGSLMDINTAGDYLLTSGTSDTPPITYNLDLYRLDANSGSWSILNFINSDKLQRGAIFAGNGSGVFYIEKGTLPSDGSEILQLVWTSLDRTSTRVLSTQGENIISPLTVVGDDMVLFINNKHELVMTNPAGERRTYTMETGFTIKQLDYNVKTKTIYFIGSPNTAEENNLYSMALDNDGQKLKPSRLAQDVNWLDVSTDSSDVLYIQRNMPMDKLFIYSPEKKLKTEISQGNYTQAFFDRNTDHIIAAQFDDPDIPQYQSIWIMGIDGKNKQQMLSPHLLSSNIRISPASDTIYFSALEEDPTMNDQQRDMLYAITYRP